jgi:hypothetical protein
MTILGLAAVSVIPASGQEASPSASTSPRLGALPLSETEGGTTLEPGRYTDSAIGQTLTFEIGDDWILAGPPIPGVGFALIREESGSPYLGVAGFDGVVFSDPCLTAKNAATFGPAPEPVEATAEALVSHIAAHPFVTATEPIAVEVAGYPGFAIEVTVSVPLECEPAWAWLWVLPVVNDYHLADGQLARIVAFDAPRGVIVTSAEVFADGDIDSFAAETTALLDSLEVGEQG